jgi:hypothetical protein
MGQVIKFLAPCLAFAKAYSPSKAHHKTMKVIREYIGDFQACVGCEGRWKLSLQTLLVLGPIPKF